MQSTLPCLTPQQIASRTSCIGVVWAPVSASAAAHCAARPGVSVASAVCVGLLSQSHARRRAAARKSRAISTASTSNLGGEKSIWFVRHGQAEHNVLYESGQADACKALLDPKLTALGETQAADVARDPLLLPYLDSVDECIELAVVSPLRRTVQTAVGALGAWVDAEKDRRFILHADLQETGEVPCDTGSPLEELEACFAGVADTLDYRELWPGWEQKVGPYEDSGPALKARIYRFKRWLLARPEKRIVVVAHHNLLAAMCQVTFLNCEVRQFSLGPNGVLTAAVPLVSRSDEELSEKELQHLKVYDPLVRRKFKVWRLDEPARVR